MSDIQSHCTDDRREQQQQQCVAQREYPSSSSSLLLSVLPPELLIHHILPHLTYLDLCSLSQVNKILKKLIDTSDQLWKNAIETEMLVILDGSSPDEKLFENEKSRFEYLYERRQKQQLTCVDHTIACGRRTNRLYLFCKYITVRSSINIIQKEEQNHELYVYYLHGEPQNNINVDMMDDHSQQLLTEPENINESDGSIRSMMEIRIKCLKCKSKCYYPPRSCSQPQPYHWFVSYLPTQDDYGERVEVIEIYCGKCQRFSLWKKKVKGSAGCFVPPKDHEQQLL